MPLEVCPLASCRKKISEHPYGIQDHLERYERNKKSFTVEVEYSADLTYDDIWPDGDGPDNPTLDDVKQVIEGEGKDRFLNDWDILNNPEITLSGDGGGISLFVND